MSKVLLIAYDNDSYIHYFPMGLAYVASVLEEKGHKVEIYQQDIYHYPDEELTEWIDICDETQYNHVDVVGIGMCAGSWQYKKLLGLVGAIHKSRHPPLIWLGGHLVSPEPKYFKKITHADSIYTGEYDYREDVDSIPYPAWHKFNIDYYALIRLPNAQKTDRCFPVLSGRGCPFHCSFCYRMHKGYRARSNQSIIQEIKMLQKQYHINYIDFSDELLMIGEDRPIKLSESIKPLGIKWCCNGRLNYAKPNVLKAMKEAGCVFINYGIESVDDEVLANMNKKLTYKQIVSGVEATLEAGISPGLNMIWGNIGDTKETLRASVDFLLKYDDHAQLRTIRPVTPYPGCDLYYEAIKQGKLRDCADFYENKHTNDELLTVNFTNLSNDEFHRCLEQANLDLWANYSSYQNERMCYQIRKLYEYKNTSFRGFRHT